MVLVLLWTGEFTLYFYLLVAECPTISLPSNAHRDTDNKEEGTVVGKFCGLVHSYQFSPLFTEIGANRYWAAHCEFTLTQKVRVL